MAWVRTIRVDASRRGKELLNPSISRQKCKARTVVGGEGRKKSLLCVPGSESRLGMEKEKEGQDNIYMG